MGNTGSIVDELQTLDDARHLDWGLSLSRRWTIAALTATADSTRNQQLMSRTR